MTPPKRTHSKSVICGSALTWCSKVLLKFVHCASDIILEFVTVVECIVITLQWLKGVHKVQVGL